MRRVVLVLLGGFCGTLARYLLSPPLHALATPLLPWSRAGLPYEVLAINLSGAFLMGLLYGLVERGLPLTPDARLALGTGFLGAYTTFSTLVYGGDRLVLLGIDLPGLSYLGGSVVLGVACAWAGEVAAESLMRPRHLLWNRLPRIWPPERGRQAAGDVSPSQGAPPSVARHSDARQPAKADRFQEPADWPDEADGAGGEEDDRAAPTHEEAAR